MGVLTNNLQRPKTIQLKHYEKHYRTAYWHRQGVEKNAI